MWKIGMQSLLCLVSFVRFAKPHSGHDVFGIQTISEESQSILDFFLRKCELRSLSQPLELLDCACRIVFILASSSEAARKLVLFDLRC